MGLRAPESENEEIENETPVETEVEEETPTEELEGSDEGEETGGDEEPPEFTPDFKLSVLEKEYEIPERFRDLITDEETQKEVREIFEKAYGLDHVKEQRDNFKTQYSEVAEKYSLVEDGVKQLKSYVEKNDYDSFFKRMGIPTENVLQWVIDRVNYNQLSPEEKAQVDAERHKELELDSARTEADQIRAEYDDRLVKAKANELRFVLGQPEVVEFAKRYDDSLGQENAFKKAVLEEGDLAWKLHGEDISGEEAVRRFMAKSGVALDALKSLRTPEPPQNPQTSPQVPTQRKDVPTIPNISGKSGSSPAKKPIRSIEDLRAAYKSM